MLLKHLPDLYRHMASLSHNGLKAGQMSDFLQNIFSNAFPSYFISNLIEVCCQETIWHFAEMFVPMRPGQNGSHFADNIFKLIFLMKHLHCDSDITKICSHGTSWQYVNTGSGTKLLPEPMLSKISRAIWHHQANLSNRHYTLLGINFWGAEVGLS